MRNFHIDFIKSYAMFAVLALHIFLGMCIESCIVTKIWYFFFGNAVPLFFMVSGYLMYNKEISIKYVANKIFKIFKYVFLTCLIYYFFLFLHNYNGYNFLGLIIDSFYSCRLGFFQKGTFWIYWYFGAMVLIYLSLPVFNKILEKHATKLLFVLLSLSCVFFLLDFLYDFERQNVIQTFRVWYWFLYFCLGYCANKRQFKIKIGYFLLFIITVLTLLFCVTFSNYLKGNEYYFGCPLYVLYVFAWFEFFLNIKNRDLSLINIFARVFLPCYTIHPFIYNMWKCNVQLGVGNMNIDILINYFILSIIVFSVSYLLVKLPFVKNLFHI